MEGIKIEKLNLPTFNIRILLRDNKPVLFDPFRKKYVAFTPEEWVRQNFAQYLVQRKNYPSGLMNTETLVKIGDKKNRSDIVVFTPEQKALVLIECKAPSVKITQQTFDQAAVYNYNLRAELLIITNGLEHFCCKTDPESNSYIFLNEIPPFEKISQ